MLKNTSELEMWFLNLSYIDKLSLYEGREKLGVKEATP